MLIEQVIKTQTIGILNKIITFQSQQDNFRNQDQSNPQQLFSATEFAHIYKQNAVIQNDQAQVLILLIQKYMENQNQKFNSEAKNSYKFSLNQAETILQSIKKSILEQKQRNNSQIPSKKVNQSEQKNVNAEKDINQVINKINHKQSSVFNKELNFQDQLSSINPKKIQKDVSGGLNILSKKLKKQNQFITRNIDRIKKYATNIPQITVPLDRSQLQQVKISHQILHKLFHLYKNIFPSNNEKQIDTNFEIIQQYKSSLNYHKILQMFLNASINLQIQNKLSLLRIIKKFAFNQNFINEEEWVKIYRAIINNLRVKEVVFQKLILNKHQEKQNSKRISKNNYQNRQNTLKQYRTRKIKTEASIEEAKNPSMANVDKFRSQYQSQKSLNYISNNIVRPIESEHKNQIKSYNPNEYRSKHKKLLTDVSQVFIKNIKKDLRSEKMIGLKDDSNKHEENLKTKIEENKNQHSYLNKAIKGKKIGQITWQVLFQMKPTNLYHNVVIPQFAKMLDNQNT